MFIPTDDSRAVAVTAAIQAGDVDALKALIDKHPELITASIGSAKEARSLLHILTDYPGHFPNNVETAKALTASGADVNATFIGEQHSETPLHFAASCDDVEVLDALLDSGADINAGGGCIVETPLSVARAFLQLKCAHRLVERGAKVTVNDAATLGLLDRVKEFYTAKEKPTKESTSLTFWNACHGGQLEIAQYLFSQGCDVNVIPPWQPQTPLDAANDVKAEDLVKWLESVGGRSAKKDE